MKPFLSSVFLFVVMSTTSLAQDFKSTSELSHLNNSAYAQKCQDLKGEWSIR